MELKLYKMLKRNKYKLTKLQYATIKGQIKSKDFNGALKGLYKLLGGESICHVEEEKVKEEDK